MVFDAFYLFIYFYFIYLTRQMLTLICMARGQFFVSDKEKPMETKTRYNVDKRLCFVASTRLVYSLCFIMIL